MVDKKEIPKVGKEKIRTPSLTSVERANISKLQKAPQTILSKEQRMLQSLFNQKNQLWGNGRPVEITQHLQTGNGLIKTGTGDTTRRLFW